VVTFGFVECQLPGVTGPGFPVQGGQFRKGFVLGNNTLAGRFATSNADNNRRGWAFQACTTTLI
jgi:hypothetical protein